MGVGVPFVEVEARGEKVESGMVSDGQALGLKNTLSDETTEGVAEGRPEREPMPLCVEEEEIVRLGFLGLNEIAVVEESSAVEEGVTLFPREIEAVAERVETGKEGVGVGEGWGA